MFIFESVCLSNFVEDSVVGVRAGSGGKLWCCTVGINTRNSALPHQSWVSSHGWSREGCVFRTPHGGGRACNSCNTTWREIATSIANSHQTTVRRVLEINGLVCKLIYCFRSVCCRQTMTTMTTASRGKSAPRHRRRTPVSITITNHYKYYYYYSRN